MAKNEFYTPAMNFLTAASSQPQPQGAENRIQSPRTAQERRSERMQILLTPSLREKLQAHAAAQGISLNEAINQIMEEKLK